MTCRKCHWSRKQGNTLNGWPVHNRVHRKNLHH